MSILAPTFIVDFYRQSRVLLQQHPGQCKKCTKKVIIGLYSAPMSHRTGMRIQEVGQCTFSNRAFFQFDEKGVHGCPLQ